MFSEEPRFSAPVQVPQTSSTPLAQHQRLSAATPQALSFAQVDVEEFSASNRVIVQGHAETLQMERNSVDVVERQVAVSRNSAVEQKRLEVSQVEGNVPVCHVQ
jgi:hypothetical protein